MRISLIIIIVTVLTTNLYAQPDSLWSRVYGGQGDQAGTSVIATRDGGFAIAGESGDDFLLIVTDENGEEQWSQTYEVDGNGFATCLIQLRDGGFVIGGNAWQGDEISKYTMIKTDAEGEEIWSRAYGVYVMNECYALTETDSGAYLLVGSTITEDWSTANFYAVKVDPDGETVWTRMYPADGRQYCYAMADAPWDAYVLAGYSAYRDDDGDSQLDPFLVKVAQTGRAFYMETIPTETRDAVTGIVKSSGGGYTIVGDAFVEPNPDAFLMSISDDLEVVWRQDYEKDGYETTWELVRALDGGFAVVGQTGPSYPSGSGYILRTDSDGEKLWDITIGGNQWDTFWDVELDGEGGYVCAGWTNSFAEDGTDAWLIRTGEDPVSVIEEQLLQPVEPLLISAYPNPFNSSTLLRYSLPLHTPGELSLVDVNGRLIQRNLLEEGSGLQTFSIDGDGLPAGMYFAQVMAGGEFTSTKLVLIK